MRERLAVVAGRSDAEAGGGAHDAEADGASRVLQPRHLLGLALGERLHDPRLLALEGLALEQARQTRLAFLHEARHLVPELPAASGGQLERVRAIRIGEVVDVAP